MAPKEGSTGTNRRYLGQSATGKEQFSRALVSRLLWATITLTLLESSVQNAAVPSSFFAKKSHLDVIKLLPTSIRGLFVLAVKEAHRVTCTNHSFSARFDADVKLLTPNLPISHASQICCLLPSSSSVRRKAYRCHHGVMLSK